MPDLRAKLQVSLGSKFRLVRELTGGGMSRVYLAEDHALEREVVVKVLAPDLVDEGRIERFRQEVLQTARLQHPTIVPLLEVGAIEDVPGHHLPYYIMPYVRGESLRSRMNHEGRLSLGVTLRVLRSVFDALAYAHAHGVIHRDIKPENIFLSGTSAVLADFGIAKAMSGPGSRGDVTQAGMAVGTPSYMAPEQLLDADRVGPRSDLYSAGVVAYEMLAARLPWDSQTPTDSLAAQARDAFTPLRTIRPDVPPSLAALIESCLAWSTDRRPESASMMLHELEATPIARTPDTSGELAAIPEITRPVVKPARRPNRVGRIIVGIAVATAAMALAYIRISRGVAPEATQNVSVLFPVLPSGTPRGAELADQIFHLLTAQLAPVTGLRLVGQVSVERMVEQGLTPAQIGDSLRAEGIDTTLVITTIRSDDGSYAMGLDLHAFRSAKDFSVAGPVKLASLETLPLDSLLAAIRRLAAQAVAKMNLGAGARSAPNPLRADALIAWFNGRDAADRRTPAGLREAIAHFEKAIVLDTSNAQARAELANTLSLTLFYRYRLRDDAYTVAARALVLADRAVDAGPGVGDGYLARALLGTITGAPTTYLKENFAAAERLAAGSPYLATFRAGLLARQGKYDEAVALIEGEVRRDPRAAGRRVASALYSLPAKQYATTVRSGTAARAMIPDVPMVSQLELWSRLQLGGQALADCGTVPAGPYLGSRALCLERTAHEKAGRIAADSLFAILTGKTKGDSTFDLSLSMTEMAMYQAAHGDTTAARQWIRQAFLESPAGVDFRFMRSGFFAPPLIALADSLQDVAWTRVSEAAALLKANRKR